MQKLEPPDSHYLSAAIGWLELGNQREADAELGQINPAFARHPDVLEIRCVIHAQENHWAQALQTARDLIAADPGRSAGYLHQAYALRRVPEGGVQAAWAALLPAYERFPEDAIIPYNLSCYTCQLEQLDTARQWLQCAIRVAGKETIKRLALHDPDLKPLREEIQKL